MSASVGVPVRIERGDFASIAGVADTYWLRGDEAAPEAAPTFLIEVPHGADRRAHYDALRARLVGDLPKDLHVFFHVNTDVGAWDYGVAVAEELVRRRRDAVVLLVRCLIPRTFIDTNRLEETTDGLGKGGMTAGLAPYVEDPSDIALLVELHRSYVALTTWAYDAVCGAGGLALSPHTYGPKTLPITQIDRGIVDALRAAHEPAVWDAIGLRPEVDLVTTTAAGEMLAAREVSEAIVKGLSEAGYEVKQNATYTLHPSTQGHRFAARHPGRVASLEVRRDLLVRRYAPLEGDMEIDPSKVARVATPIAAALLGAT